MEGFYQLNNEVLKFDIKKDLDKIIFNQYIIRRENLQRTKKDLKRGQFYLTIKTTAADLNITFGTARGLIKKFTELGIITNIFTPEIGSKKPSIYQYNSAITNNDTNNESNNDKAYNINGSEGATNNDSNNDVNNSKKEYLKTIYKKKYSTKENVNRYNEF